ncbi:MAG TPA: hypothetical protein VF912_18000 [Anaeromyxobacter sp.]
MAIAKRTCSSIRWLICVGLLALAPAALAAPYAAEPAPAPGAEPATVGSPGPSSRWRKLLDELQLGGFLGYESDGVAGIAPRVDGEVPFRAILPPLQLSWVGSIGFSHLTRSQDAYGFGVATTANVLKVLPAARLSFALTPQLTLFADTGLGLYYASTTIDDSTPYFGGTSTSHGLGFVTRFGLGAWYQLREKLKVGAALELDPYFGEFDHTTFVMQAGAMFRM